MKCKTEKCKKETNEGYDYCMECYKTWKDGQVDEFKSKAWHDDPVVDILMKINNNLSKLVVAMQYKK